MGTGENRELTKIRSTQLRSEGEMTEPRKGEMRLPGELEDKNPSSTSGRPAEKGLASASPSGLRTQPQQLPDWLQDDITNTSALGPRLVHWGWGGAKEEVLGLKQKVTLDLGSLSGERGMKGRALSVVEEIKEKKQTQNLGFVRGNLFPPSLPLRSREIKILSLCQALKGI